MQQKQALRADASGDASGADAGMEEAFIGVDVSDSVKKLLIEQSGLDGELAVAKERDELIGGDGKGLRSRAAKSSIEGGPSS